MVTPFILLNNNKIQNVIVNKLTEYFEDKTDATLKLGNISIRNFNKISIDSVYLEDINKRKLASIEHVNANLKLFSLLKGHINFSKIDIYNLDSKLYIDSCGIANFQYLIDSFKPKEQVKSPDISLPLVTLYNASISFKNYVNISDENLIKSDKINFNDIFVEHLNTQIQFSLNNQTNIKAAIKYLSLVEKSGFVISDIKANTEITDSTLTIPHIYIELPKTNFSIDSAYTKIKRINNKIDLGKTILNLNVISSQIHLPDLKAFVPELKNLNKGMSFTARIGGSLNKLNVYELSAKYGSTISVLMNFKADSLYNAKSAYFNCDINHIKFNKSSIQDIIANITDSPFILPNDLNNLGLCQYSGKISGRFPKLVLYGNLNTNIGNIKTDFDLEILDNFSTFKINGNIGSRVLRLEKLSPSSGLGNISFNSNSKIIIKSDNKFSADTRIKIKQFTFNNYRYNNIFIDGTFTPEMFSGDFLINDPNGYIDFKGTLMEVNRYKHFDFISHIKNVNLNKLKIIKSYPDLNLSLTTKADFSGDKWATMEGYVNVDSLNIINGIKTFLLNKFSISAQNDSVTYANISSDLINGGISGDYIISDLGNDILYSLSKSMPIIKRIKPKEKKHNNKISCFIEIQPLKNICQTLDINWFTTEISTIYANYDIKTNNINSNISIPKLCNNRNIIDSIQLKINNIDGIKANITGIGNLKNGKLKANLNLTGKNDTIITTLSWDNNNKNLLAGEFIAETSILNDSKESIITNTKIIPTEIIIQNKSWVINNSNIWTNFKEFTVDNFKLESEDDQIILINGTASKSSNDKINLDLKNISLDYIDQLLPEDTEISIGGIVNGKASIANALHIPEINANVKSEKFFFDGSYFGNAIADCSFNIDKTSLDFNGLVIDDNKDTTAIINGNYYISNDSLDIIGKAYGLDIAFIDYYIEDVFGKVTGKGWGDVHIHGITKTKNVAVDVDAFADNASVYVDFLKTRFFLSDSIHVDKNVIDFGEIEVKDKNGKTGIVKGKIKHNYFRDIKLDLAINVDNIMVMDTKKQDSESFYGKVFGTGNVLIKGDEKCINITCKAKSEKGTKIVIPIDNYSASENSFIIFQDIEKFEEVEKTIAIPASETNVILNLMIDATPDAEVQLIIDSKTGDMLKCTGNGNLRVTYNTNEEDIKIYGTYQIEKGSYLFTFQNALRKEFHIKEGSSISWSGDPLNANVNIEAYYQLTADVAEILDESVLSNTSRTSVPVQCLLNISGILTQPNLKFNINLPNSEEELNRALQNTLNTEEQINRQIIGLLILGKFISPETMQTSMISQNELYSVVSSTISSQLNNWASQMFNNWGFGINFRTSGEGETRSNEYEFNFVYTPTSRLIINGNLGYRDDALSATNFIGDFDIEYKLIQSGKLRAKAYTHTNDYREFKKGLTTQGVGIIYSENFNSLKELWLNWKENIKQNKEENKKKREANRIKKEERKLKKQQKIDYYKQK